MKKYISILSLCLVLLSGCEGKEEVIIANTDIHLCIDKSTLQLNKDKSFDKIKVLSRTGEFYAISNNHKVAKTVIEKNELVIIGVAQGETTIQVINNIGDKDSVKVSVDYNLTRPVFLEQNVIVRKGDSRTIEIDKDVILRATEGKENIGFNVQNENKLVIEGKEQGISILDCEIDYWPLTRLNIEIVNKYPLVTVSKLEITETPGKKQTLIRMGNGNYRVESADPSIAIGRILPYEGPTSDYFHNEAVLEVESFDKRGYTALTVTDEMNIKNTIHINVR